METEQGNEKVNNEENIAPTDSKVGQLLVRRFLSILQDILPTLNLPIEDDLSYDTLF